LVDIKVAFWNGYPETRREVPLYQLDQLLESVALDAASAAQLSDAVREALKHVIDYQGKPQPLVEDYQPFADEPGYLRVRKDEFEQTYRDATGNALTVPGVILAVDKHTLRTDAVIVDAVLGQGNALDPYSKALQEQAVKNKALANDALASANAREKLGRDLVETGTTTQAENFAKIFYPPPAEPAAP
jgi:hypothetical protein